MEGLEGRRVNSPLLCYPLLCFVALCEAVKDNPTADSITMCHMEHEAALTPRVCAATDPCRGCADATHTGSPHQNIYITAPAALHQVVRSATSPS